MTIALLSRPPEVSVVRLILRGSEGLSEGEGEGVSHKIIPSYLRRSFRTLLTGSSSGKVEIYSVLNRFSNQVESYGSHWK